MQLNFPSYTTAFAITPSDTTALNLRAIYVGGAGNVAVKPNGASAVTFTAPPVGLAITSFSTFVSLRVAAVAAVNIAVAPAPVSANAVNVS